MRVLEGPSLGLIPRRARPSYRSEAISHIRKAVRGTSPLNIVEYVHTTSPQLGVPDQHSNPLCV